jgi:hypothetical protein
MCIVLHENYVLFLSDFKETNFLGGLGKYSNMKFNENLLVGAEVSLADVRTDREMVKLIVVLRTFAIVLNKRKEVDVT